MGLPEAGNSFNTAVAFDFLSGCGPTRKFCNVRFCAPVKGIVDVYGVRDL